MSSYELGEKQHRSPMVSHWQWVGVPSMLFIASLFMALAWIGHLKFEQLPFTSALFLCWLLVLPEYFLNVSAIRLGYGFYTGAQMASFRLCSGVICVALVSRFFLNEALTVRKLVGFGVMILAMMLITIKRPRSKSQVRPFSDEAIEEETCLLK